MLQCRECAFSCCKSEFTDHYIEAHLKNLNALQKNALYKSETVTINLPIKTEDRLTECFVCLVCKNCEVQGRYSSLENKDDKAEFFTFHKIRCSSGFHKIAHLLKVSDHELALASVPPVKSKKHPACPKCGYDAGGNAANLKRHLGTCGNVKRVKMTTCDKCDYTSLNISNLKRHMATCKAEKKEETSESNVGNSGPPPLPPSPLPSPPRNTVRFEVEDTPNPIVGNTEMILAFNTLRQRFEPDDSDDDEEDDEGNTTRKTYSDLEIARIILKEHEEALAEAKAARTEKWLLESAARKLVGDSRRNLSIGELAEEVEKCAEGTQERIVNMERKHAKEIARLRKELQEKEAYAATFETLRFGQGGRVSYSEDSD